MVRFIIGRITPPQAKLAISASNVRSLSREDMVGIVGLMAESIDERLRGRVILTNSPFIMYHCPM